MPVLGTPVTLAQAFDVALTPTDPDAVTLEILDPAAVSTILAWPLAPDPEAIDHPGAGEFSYTLTPDQVGVWRYRWTGTGAPAAVVDGSFEITSIFEPQTYASLQRVIDLFSKPPKPQVQTILSQKLAVATDELIEECAGRDYFRHPSSGTDTWSPDRTDLDGLILHAHYGVVSIDSIAVDDVALDPATYIVRGDAPYQARPVAMRDPAFHVERLDRRRWPADPARIVLTGARGWGNIPAALVEACAARARQLAFADPSYTGSIPGPDELNAGGFVSDRWPQVFYRFLTREHGRFSACLFDNDSSVPSWQ